MNKTAITFLVGCAIGLHYFENLILILSICLAILLISYYSKKFILMPLIFGLCWSSFQALSHHQQILTETQANQTFIITGVVKGLPTYQNDILRFQFIPDKKTLPDLIRLSWYPPHNNLPRSGERWQLKVKLKPPHGFKNPAGFDYEAWLFSQKIGATGYVKASEDNIKIDNAPPMHIDRFRQQIANLLQQQIPDASYLSLIKGLTLGIRDDISQHQWQILRTTGTSHLLAISGLHIGLASAMGFFIFQWLWRFNTRAIQGISAQQVGAIAGLIFAICYATISGLSLPTQRALIMVATAMIAIMINRSIFPSHVLSLACMLVVLFDPFSLFSAGFWLSFAAVALILFLTTQHYPMPRYQWISIHGWLSIGLIPLLMLFFNQISLIAPIANLLAVPFVSLLIVPLLLTALATLIFSATLSQYLLSWVDQLLHLLWYWLEILAELPFADWHTPALDWPFFMLILLITLLSLLPQKTPAKWLICLLLVPVLLNNTQRTESGEFLMTVLDVGQGLAVVIETSHHTLVYDVGPKFSETFDTGSLVVLPYLQSRRIQHIDRLIISHTDNDHIGGLKSIEKALPIERLISNQRLTEHDNQLCLAGQAWQWDEVNFEILQPFVNQKGTKNNRSCVLKISGKHSSALLTGDIEKNTERELIQYYGNKLQAEVLLIPHHGSKTSSSKAFLDVVSPKLAIFSLGYRNHYGFPNKTILERYQSQQIRLFRTDQNGAVQVSPNQDPITWRQ